MTGEGSSGSCYRCGVGGQSSRFCRNCGAPLLSMAESPRRRRFPRLIRSPFVLGFLAALTATTVILGGAVAAFGLHSVPSNGICFANPLARTSLWPYSPASGSLTLTYYFEHGTAPYEIEYGQTVRGAFRAWSRAWPVLHFRRTSTQSRAQILIRYGDYGTHGYWFDHAGLTSPEVDVFGCNLTRATIEINNSYLVHDGNLEYPQPMLRHLLLHEIGHALGMRHVYSPIPSVMVPTSDAYRYVNPQPFDVHTLSNLYPSAQAEKRISRKNHNRSHWPPGLRPRLGSIPPYAAQTP